MIPLDVPLLLSIALLNLLLLTNVNIL
jgi:hypothetical protein